jgi:hypothetical protein
MRRMVRVIWISGSSWYGKIKGENVSSNLHIHSVSTYNFSGCKHDKVSMHVGQ